jgi:hypothetical protein
MLGDNPEKSKNPLKKAMRRRNAKTVQFAPPVYVEASDIDYSTDEDEHEGDHLTNEEDRAEAQNAQHDSEEEIAAVEPLKPRSQVKEGKPENDDADQLGESGETDKTNRIEKPRISEELFDQQGKKSGDEQKEDIKDVC